MYWDGRAVALTLAAARPLQLDALTLTAPGALPLDVTSGVSTSDGSGSEGGGAVAGGACSEGAACSGWLLRPVAAPKSRVAGQATCLEASITSLLASRHVAWPTTLLTVLGGAAAAGSRTAAQARRDLVLTPPAPAAAGVAMDLTR